MGEPWIERYETKTEKEIFENTIQIEPLACPPDTIALTAGIDPGQGGFHFAVIAWRRDLSAHLVHYGFLADWDQITKLVWENQYLVQGTEKTLPIWRAGIDTGGSRYEAETLTMAVEAYNWLRAFGRGKCFGTKGASIPQGKKVKISIIDRMPGKQGRVIPGGLTLLILDTSWFKDLIHWRLQIKEGDPGRLTFNKDTGEDFVSHLLAEEKRRNRAGAYEWVQIRRANHFLDCLVINYALADMEVFGGIKVIPKPKQPQQTVRNQWPVINPITNRPRGEWMKW